MPRHALRNHRQRPKKFGLILCMASSIRPILSRPRLRELMASSSVPFVASVARCPRRAFGVVNSSLRSFPTSACSILSRLEPADWPVPAAAAGLSTLGLVTVRGETGACALAGAASLGTVAVLVIVAVLVVAQPPSELAASWKGSSMRERMTPTPEAPGCRRQVVCSCEGPPVRVPTPLKATRPLPSAM